MKKKFSLLLCLLIFLVTGCGKQDIKTIIKDVNKDMNSLNSYHIEGKMEIINNEDVYKYDIDVSYKKDNYYKVSLKNESNNHEQVILKNNDGVYVKTQESTKQKLNVI